MFDGSLLKTVKHIHFIGIGGSGMFPIVQILHAQGYFITGSDNNESDTVSLERSMGIPVALWPARPKTSTARTSSSTPAAIWPTTPS